MEIKKLIMDSLAIVALAFVQNVAFSIVSRSRNRSSQKYHLFASVFSNGIWFMTMKMLVAANLTLALIPAYLVGTVSGSLFGVGVSMKIERWLKAGSDDHIRPKKDPEIESLKQELRELKELVQKGSCDQTFPA